MKKVLNEKGQRAIDALFANGFDRPTAYAVGFPTSTPKSRAQQMYQLLRRPEADAYYQERFEEYKQLLSVDKITLVASLVKQVEFFAEVMYMSSEGCPIKNPEGKPEIEEEIDEWWSRYGRMKDVMSAAENNAAKNMIAKLIGAFEPEKIIIEEQIYNVGFDLGDDKIQDAEVID